MPISDLCVAQIQAIQRTADETMTRIILLDTEMVGPVQREWALIIEPLSVEIVTDA